MRRSKPQRLVLGLGFRVEVVPALAHGAMGHGLLKPIVSPLCSRAKGGGQGALRLFEMAEGVVARVTSRIDVCTDLKIEAALGQDTLATRPAGMGGDMMTTAPRLRDNALVARSCPPGTSPIKSEYRVLRYMVRPCVGPTGLPRWGPRLLLSASFR